MELIAAARAEKLDVQENAPLAPLTTFRIGGPATALVTARSPDEVALAVRVAVKSGAPWALLGGGSNLLVPDAGFPGLVILVVAARMNISGIEVEAEAGVPFHRVVTATAWAGLGGLAFGAGIPGTIGGAVVGNAGAWGCEIGQRVLSARVVRADNLETVEIPHRDLGFDYRTSVLQKSRDVVLSVRLGLEAGDRKALIKEVDGFLEQRAPRTPELPCAGSYFRNLPPERPGEKRRAAGALLEQVGALGLRVGDAGVWEKHANFILNLGHAKCRDVLALQAELEKRVFDRFGVHLTREVRILEPQTGLA